LLCFMNDLPQWRLYSYNKEDTFYDDNANLITTIYNHTNVKIRGAKNKTCGLSTTII
jgi:hypothetical protein